MLAQFYPPVIGGEERHVKNLAAALAKRGHDVSVATLAMPGQSQMTVEDGVRIFRLQGTLQNMSRLFSEQERRHVPPFPDPGLVSGLRRVVSECQPEIVHAHNWLLHSFLPLKHWSGAQLVVTLHDLSLVCAKKSMMNRGVVCSGPEALKCLKCASNHYGVLKGCVTASANWMCAGIERKLVDKFLAVSQAIADGNRLREARVAYDVIPNFVPDDIGVVNGHADARLLPLPATPYLLYVGDLTRFKGALVLLEAYQRLRQAPPLVMIGRRSQDMPATLPGNVHIFESWPHAAVMQAWQRCMFGIVPSILPEACATVVMECMGMGKPLVATGVGGTPDLIGSSDAAILVPPGDATALAGALQTMIDNPQRRQQMSRSAIERAGALQAKSVVPRIEKVYADLLTGHHGCSRVSAQTLAAP